MQRCPGTRFSLLSPWIRSDDFVLKNLSFNPDLLHIHRVRATSPAPHLATEGEYSLRRQFLVNLLEALRLYQNATQPRVAEVDNSSLLIRRFNIVGCDASIVQCPPSRLKGLPKATMCASPMDAGCYEDLKGSI